MSGDTQPRKRKDKKRKKDEGVELLAAPTFSTSKGEIEETTFHVHKEGGTGGGICAKIIFFILFSALIVLVGMIITEHRGLTDLDTVDTKSRFSGLFEGWIDDSPGHDEDDHIGHTVADDHDEEDEAEDHEDEEESLAHDEDEHDEAEEDEEDNVDKASEEETEEDAPASEEAVDENEDEEDEDRPEESTEDAEEDEEEETPDDEVSAEQAEDEEEEGDDNYDQDDEQQEDDDQVVSTEREERSAEEDDENDAVDEDEDGDRPDEEEEEEEKADVPDEGYESEEKEEEVKPPQSKERKVKKSKASAEVKEGDAEQSPPVIKVGVGLAILVVAYVVLVRKRRSAPREEVVEKDVSPDLSRRNTIVVPPKLQEIVQDIEQDVEESEEEGETESDEEDEEEKPKPRSIKAKYQELRTTYTRSLTPESETDYANKTSGVEDEYEEEGEEGEEGEEEEEEESEEDDEEELESDPDEAEDDDEELLKRLEEKYGRIKRVSTGSEDRSEGSDSDNTNYPYANITNKGDWDIKDKLDESQKSVQNNPAYAITLFDALLKTYPFSPRSLFGKAQALDKLADIQRSNQLLKQAISTYLQLLNLNDVPDALFLAVAEICINRMRFSGNYENLFSVHNMLIERFKDTPKHRNDLAVTYLTVNRVNEARIILKDTLAQWPNDGFALVHYGFILKTSDNNLKEGIDYMQRGIKTKEPGVIDGRFFFHIGDALARLGRAQDAMKLYEEGVENGLFLSKYQRSLYNVDRLTRKPWWNKNDIPYQKLFDALEKNYKQIYKEGLAVMNKKGYFVDESENLKDRGDWKQLELFARGKKNTENCKKCPITCQIIDSFPEAKSCRRGQTKFSVMHPGTHVWPHCGPTNCRLRVHLGLKVPPKTFIRVADDIRSWEEGKVIIFDDSFEHEVWHNGTEYRLVLIIDVWHPQLTMNEKRSLSPI